MAGSSFCFRGGRFLCCRLVAEGSGTASARASRSSVSNRSSASHLREACRGQNRKRACFCGVHPSLCLCARGRASGVGFGSGLREWASGAGFGSGLREWASGVGFGSGRWPQTLQVAFLLIRRSSVLIRYFWIIGGGQKGGFMCVNACVNACRHLSRVHTYTASHLVGL